MKINEVIVNVPKFRLPVIETGDTPYYHGTHATYTGVPRISPTGIYGPGIYLTRSAKHAESFGPIVKEYRVYGKLGSDHDLTDALNMAKDEDYVRKEKYERATSILINHGFSGIQDGLTTVIFSPDSIIPSD